MANLDKQKTWIILRIAKNQNINTMKLSYLISLVAEYISGAVKESDTSAKYIISEVLGVRIPELLLMHDKQITKKTIIKIFQCAQRRAQNEPLQYIFGKAYFRDLHLKVGRGVLIPRPETELLVDITLKEIPQNSSVCEIGLGSGAISLSIALERPDCEIFASELSPIALRYARFNKKTLKVKNAKFFKGNLFAPFKHKKFDAIIANLPYVKNTDMKKLPREIRDYEPKMALEGGKDGLDIIRKFFLDAPSFAKSNAFIIAELSSEQISSLKKFLADSGFYSNIRILKDFRKKRRFIAANCLI